MTTTQLVNEVNRGEIVMLDNWYFMDKDNRNKIHDQQNWDLFEYVEVYHPEFQMDNDDEAKIMWIYLKNRNS